MPAPTPAIICSGLTFAWPDGTPLFTDLSLVIGRGRTGLIGLNGSGKSTLLRLIAGELTPGHGTVQVAGELGYVPQTVTLAGTRVDEALGIAPTRAALAAIEAGDASEENFARVGSDWDVEERARATLDSLGLEQVPLDRRISELSGGESVLLSLAAQFLRRPEVLLLDEPTNNLDLGARHRLYDTAGSWTGAIVIVSHDRELLDRVDQIAELRAGAVRWYGGNLTDYEEALAAEQEAAERMVRVAEADMRRQERELIETRTKLDRRVRYGQKMQDTSRMPKIVANERKRQAQVSAGKLPRHPTRPPRQGQQAAGRAAEEAVRDDAEIRVDLPTTAVPAGRTVLTLSALEIRYGARADLIVRGPERIALTGRNGAGKTTLLRTVTGDIEPVSGAVKLAVPVGYLPQRLDILDPGLTVTQNVAKAAPVATNNQIRAQLARFLFRGRRADQRAGTLSGGELFRAALATLLLAQPAPQLLLLDEPTNSLDMASMRQLSGALRSYQGALIVASHDAPFLRALGITRWLRLDGELTDIDPL